MTEMAEDRHPGEVLDDESTETTVGRGGPVSHGRRNPIPTAKPLPQWRSSEIQDRGDHADGGLDYSSLEKLNNDMRELRVRMNKVRRSLRAAQREAVTQKIDYQRALRRALVAQSGGSAETRKAAAEIACEEQESAMVMSEQVAREYETLLRTVREDCENAKIVSLNLRSIIQSGI